MAAEATKNQPRKNRRLSSGLIILGCCMFIIASHNFFYHDVFEKMLLESGGDAPDAWAPPTKDRRNGIAPGGEGGALPALGGVDSEGFHPLAGIDCAPHGGPANADASEMVFWSDIESDSKYRSPFHRTESPQYLTFEPDHGGWNNIRMAMETVLVLAHATGRTLVLPPESKIYLLGNDSGKHKTDFTFNDFFHLDSIASEHDGIDVITMEEFLTKEGMAGNLKDSVGNVRTPPGDRVDWNGESHTELNKYLRAVGTHPHGWNPSDCVVGIPVSRDPSDIKALRDTMEKILLEKLPDNEKDYDGKPTPVDGPVVDRLKEMLSGRDKLCVYDQKLQDTLLMHMKVDHNDDSRLLTHFYAFLFFQSYMDDLYYKRFIRDHVRYIDEIVCAAARIVTSLRAQARAIGNNNPNGVYDSMHVRRGDFQYKQTRIPAEEILSISKEELEEGSVLFIATDERDKTFFKPIKERYSVFFLDDFLHEIEGINSNFYGMIDQLVASKGRIFFGTWWSTLSGYVNRMRGYYIAKHQLPGHEDGTMESYYFVPKGRRDQMRAYKPVKKPIYMREFPTAWRDIDKGIEAIHDENARQFSAK